MRLDRRRFHLLAGTVVAGLTGCTRGETGRTTTAIFLTNETENTLTATLRVSKLGESDDGRTPMGGEQLLIRRSELSPGEQLVVDGEELPADPLRVRILVRRGPDRRYDWERIDELSTLDARIEDGSIRFTELD